MKTLCKFVTVKGEIVQNGQPTFGQLAPSNERGKVIIDELKGDEAIDGELGNVIANLWKDDSIQNAYTNRSQFQLTDSAKYFFERIKDVAAQNYLPTQQDVLRSRVRTTGIVENDFEIDGNKFKMFDVGGQRNERKKWIHCFENVTAVLFVVAISEYDQMLYEDESTNRMVEALNLFDEVCNSRWFQETSMILFLNKRDLFGDKIAKVPLTVCFPDYDGENTYEAGSEFLRSQFEAKNHNDAKIVYSHITCATDTDNIKVVFNAVKDIIIRQSLNEAGLV
jgi:GTPase SAR1 family protein